MRISMLPQPSAGPPGGVKTSPPTMLFVRRLSPTLRKDALDVCLCDTLKEVHPIVEVWSQEHNTIRPSI